MQDSNLPVTQVQAQVTRPQVWTDPSGTHYLVKRETDGSPTFLPLSPVQPPTTPVTPLSHQRVTTYRDPFAMALIGLGVLLGVILIGYAIGFFAGAAGQRVVIVPREPVCTTRESGFLFWTSRTRECN